MAQMKFIFPLKKNIKPTGSNTFESLSIFLMKKKQIINTFFFRKKRSTFLFYIKVSRGSTFFIKLIENIILITDTTNT